MMTIGEFFAEPAGKSKAADQLVRQLLADAPGQTLDDLPRTERARTTIHFVGWRHATENSAAVARYLKRLRPDLIIEESPSSIVDRDYVNASYYCENMYLRGFRVYHRVSTKSGVRRVPVGRILKRVLRADPFWQANLALRDARKQPVIVPMDLTMDKMDAASRRRRRTHKNLGQVLHLDRPGALLRGPVPLRARALAWYLDEGAYTAKREAQMTQDIKSAAARALQAYTGSVTVVVLFGAAHLPVARNFAGLGVALQEHNLVANGQSLNSFTPPAEWEAWRMTADTGHVDDQLLDDVLLDYLLTKALHPRTSARLLRLVSPATRILYTPGSFLVTRLPLEQRRSLIDLWTQAGRSRAKTQAWQFSRIGQYANDLALWVLQNEHSDRQSKTQAR